MDQHKAKYVPLLPDSLSGMFSAFDHDSEMAAIGALLHIRCRISILALADTVADVIERRCKRKMKDPTLDTLPRVVGAMPLEYLGVELAEKLTYCTEHRVCHLREFLASPAQVARLIGVHLLGRRVPADVLMYCNNNGIQSQLSTMLADGETEETVAARLQKILAE